ncbi:hypothetical protein N7478_006202 [Penicillium angulare]|uniref:uncharacterized protein n=1 Tax=Penicillium angulare TaxID=116970 RepID=UPI002540AD59|nr:uncharacterized protein N7478_006202 [Penicillium angulare]KAJ5280830.1 hypothetical protein N7478_006202 [Penicillium angulare]
MARAAVLPSSPAKRGPRAASRTTLNKSTKAASAASSAAKKRAPVKSSFINAHDDLDSDTDDELGMMMKEQPDTAARPRGRPAGRVKTKPPVPRRTITKTTPAPALEESHDDMTSNQDEPKPAKKRVGRPRKNTTAEPAAPKPRGRPKADATKKTIAPRKNIRAATEDNTSDQSDGPKHITIATNSTTMRSNLLRGPAKKKTVTFQEADGESEEEEEQLEAPAAGRRKAAVKSTDPAKSGLGGAPVRKAATATGRGRKPAAAKKTATKPLSPKKAKQIAKTLSAYASSDGEEDELTAAKYDIKSPVKLIVHSPAKQQSEAPTLCSPVRKINFTPKKASNLVDENGEPKLPTPKHGSTTGLSSPVRRINFTPNKNQHTVTDNGHLALPPGKAIDFSDSVFMSSPARRPEASSPFKFSFRESANCGPLFRDELNGAPALQPSHGPSSPLKLSPKKGRLGASFSQSPSKAETPSIPARASLIQSPAKRIASPFKSSLFSAKSSVTASTTPNDDNSSHSSSISSMIRRLSSHQEEEEDQAADEDLEMVEEVARDIFGIELQSDGKSPSQSPSPQQIPEIEAEHELQTQEVSLESLPAMTEEEAEDADIDQKIEELQEEIRHEPEDFGTICFNTMEDLQRPFKNLDAQNDTELYMTLSDGESVNQVDESDYDEPIEDLVMESVEPDEPLDELDLAPSSPAQETEMFSVPRTPITESPLDLALFEECAFEEPGTPTPARTRTSLQSFEDEFEDENPSETGSVVHRPYEQQEAEIDSYDVDEMANNDSDSSIASDAEMTVMSQTHLPYDVDNGEESLFEALGPAPPTAPTPPVEELTEFMQDSVKSHTRLFDINNTEERMDMPSSPMDTTQSDIPTPVLPRWLHTTRKQVWPLGSQHTLSKPTISSTSARCFSLVGPLERSAETHIPDEGDVSYPDLSRSPLANTPRLFSELPLQPRSDDTSVTPPSPSKSPSARDSDNMINSPSRSDIFEDLEPVVPLHLRTRESLPSKSTGRKKAVASTDEDKENLPAPAPLPATPMKALPDHLRTVHTVSKVPLKGEGEISPLKMPRKRGLSLSSTSPTRSSPRIRKSVFLPRMDSAPALAPPEQVQVAQTPSPKRHCSAARRVSSRMSSLPAPKSPSVVSSPGKTPRRNPSPKKQALRGAVVYVDVHTTEGEDASGIFIELLQQMGARCFKSWSWNPRASMSPVDGVDPLQTIGKVGITHVVYKDGGLRTLEKVKHAGGLVKCVGVGWVLDCERENKWLDESPYVIDNTVIPRGGAKRRKSMEPRALSNINGTLKHIAEPSTPSASGRRCGADNRAMEGFRKITPPTPRGASPSTPTQQSTGDRYQVPQTPGYNFSNLDAIGMSPATPYFLSNRTQLVQQSCPPKQSGRGLFPVQTPTLSFEEDDQENRRQQRARMEAARRKSYFHKPVVASPLAR